MGYRISFSPLISYNACVFLAGKLCRLCVQSKPPPQSVSPSAPTGVHDVRLPLLLGAYALYFHTAHPRQPKLHPIASKILAMRLKYIHRTENITEAHAWAHTRLSI